MLGTSLMPTFSHDEDPLARIVGKHEQSEWSTSGKVTEIRGENTNRVRSQTDEDTGSSSREMVGRSCGSQIRSRYLYLATRQSLKFAAIGAKQALDDSMSVHAKPKLSCLR